MASRRWQKPGSDANPLPHELLCIPRNPDVKGTKHYLPRWKGCQIVTTGGPANFQKQQATPWRLSSQMQGLSHQHLRKSCLKLPPPVLKYPHVSGWGWDGGKPANLVVTGGKWTRRERSEGRGSVLGDDDKSRNEGGKPRTHRLGVSLLHFRGQTVLLVLVNFSRQNRVFSPRKYS